MSFLRLSRPAAGALVASVLLSLPVGAAEAQTSPEKAMTVPAMQIQSSYPVVVTDKVRESRDFYVRWFGFEALFEASWFVYLQAGSGQPWGMAFMSSDHPSQPPGPETFSGKGVFMTFQVADAAAEYSRLKEAGVRIAYPLRDEPWGQRRFGLLDPSGLWLDIVQQVEPAAGYWDPYMQP